MNPDDQELRRALDARSAAPSPQFRARLSETLKSGRPRDSVSPAIAGFVAVALVVATVGLFTYVRLHHAPTSGVASPARTETTPSPTGKGTGPLIYLPTNVYLSAPSRSVVWAAVADEELFVSSDSGANWDRRSLPPIDGGPVQISFVDASDGWLLIPGVPETQCNAAGLTLWRTVDGAHTWTRLTPVGIARAQCKNELAFIDSTHGFVTAWDDSNRPTVFRTADAGATWLAATLPDPTDFVTQGGGFTLHVAWVKQLGKTIYLEAMGSQDGPNHDRQYIYRSTDGGATWTVLMQVPSPEVVIVTDARWLLLIAPGQSQETTNAGQQWHPYAADYNPDSPVLGGNQVLFGDSDIGYAEGRGAMQRTADGGLHWSRIETPGVFWPG